MFKLKFLVLVTFAFSCSNNKLINKKNKDISICKISSEKKNVVINKLYKKIKELKEKINSNNKLHEFDFKSQKENMKICRNKVLHYKVLLNNLKTRNKRLKEYYKEYWRLKNEYEYESGGC
mgnify:CR=1 FL=1|tara:strand:+ start:639 stop:1001 length:363 start_codon:yes stop_codon:yes gene_type:complete